MTPKEIKEIKANAELLTSAIEHDWKHNETSTHSTDYWMRCAVEMSRAIPKLVAEIERMQEEAGQARLDEQYDAMATAGAFDEEDPF